MAVLKTLVLAVVIFGIGINCEEIAREGRCGGGNQGRKSNQKFKGLLNKPYPLRHHEFQHKFNTGKKDSYLPKDAGAFSFSHVKSEVNNQDVIKKPVLNKKPEIVEPKNEEPFDFDVRMLGDKLVADPVEIPSRVETSPRLRISADGEVTFARSINFHDDNDGLEDGHEHEHMDEDHDQFHKIRTARSAPSSDTGSGPQQLSSQLDKLQGTNTQQGIDVANSASAGEYLQMTASGDQISVTNQGSSTSSGTGTIYSSGTTTVTTSGSSNGWKEQDKK